MPTLASIQDAYEAGIAANPARADVLRDMRRPFRKASAVVNDLAEGLRYLRVTAPAAVTRERFLASLSFILPVLDTLPDGPGAGSLRDLRGNLRTLVTDVTTPADVKQLAERIKRTYRVDQNGGGLKLYDQQAGDPINALADAALTVIQAANSTAEQLAAATDVLNRWKELTPDQPTV